MNIQEQIALEKEIETLNNNIYRKNNVISGLFAIIVNTNNINLIAEAGNLMKEENF